MIGTEIQHTVLSFAKSNRICNNRIQHLPHSWFLMEKFWVYTLEKKYSRNLPNQIVFRPEFLRSNRPHWSRWSDKDVWKEHGEFFLAYSLVAKILPGCSIVKYVVIVLLFDCCCAMATIGERLAQKWISNEFNLNNSCLLHLIMKCVAGLRARRALLGSTNWVTKGIFKLYWKRSFIVIDCRKVCLDRKKPFL